MNHHQNVKDACPQPDFDVDDIDTASSSRLGCKNYEENAILKAVHNQAVNLQTRLLSIERDTIRTLTLYEQLVSNKPNIPIFGNARAGSWYVPTKIPNHITQTCSFKSADGHYGKWSSSPRRPNLHVLKNAIEYDGCIIVDVTRSGKRVPDSISKTIPIWCSVITYLISGNIDLHLHSSISKNEENSIRERLPYFIRGWQNSCMEEHEIIKKAKELGVKKIRVLWCQPSRLTWEFGIPDDLDYLPIVCISGSDAIERGHRSFIENRLDDINICGIDFPGRGSFNYVQGAGDDEENWSRSLTPDLFWMYRNDILNNHYNGDLNDLERRVDDIVINSSLSSFTITEDTSSFGFSILPVWSSSVSITQLHNPTIQTIDKFIHNVNKLHKFKLIIILGHSPETETSNQTTEPSSIETEVKVLKVPLVNQKGKTEYKYAFGRSLGICLSILRKHCILNSDQALITCTSKCNGDWTSGLVIAWLCWHCKFDNNVYKLSNDCSDDVIDKQDVHRTMMQFLSSFPSFQLSRPTLKQLNRFFSSPLPSSTIETLPENQA